MKKEDESSVDSYYGESDLGDDIIDVSFLDEETDNVFPYE